MNVLYCSWRLDEGGPYGFKDWVESKNIVAGDGRGVPTLKVAGTAFSASLELNDKFPAIDLSSYFNTSSTEFGSRGSGRQSGLIRTPGGKLEFQGIPFLLGRDDERQKSWIAFSTATPLWAVANIEIPIGRAASCLCLAQFCDWDPAEADQTGVEVIEYLGQKLAEAAVVYEDGSEYASPIRRRLEVHSPSVSFGYQCFVAMPGSMWAPTRWAPPPR